MDDALTEHVVANYADAHFVNLRLDSLSEASSFHRWLGSRGLLGSCVLEVGEQAPQVLAVSLGYMDARSYLELLVGVTESRARVARLASRAVTSPAARLELGEVLQAHGSLARARELFASIDAPAALRGQALEHLARLDVEAGQISRARLELTQARALSVEQASERWLLSEALVLSAERHVSLAVATLRAGLPSIESEQELSRAVLLLAELEHELGENQPALERLRNLRSARPGTSWARLASQRIEHLENPEPGHTH